MAVRQDDNRRSWRVFQAALVMILRRDERHLSPQLRRRMLRWMQRSPENLIHLFAIARIDRELGQRKLLDRSAELARATSRVRGGTLVTRRAALIAGAAAVTLVVGLSISALRDGDAIIRHVTLDDGSVMHVLRGSVYEVEFSDQARLINLPHGEAVFEVAKDPERPFIVRSQLSDSIAIGTRFGVIADAAATTTTVSEGEVRVVVPTGADPMTGQAVHAGGEIRVIAGATRPASVMRVNAERRISWSAGWLTFEGDTVGEAVQTFNRFSDVHLKITEPDLSNARLTYGRFELDKPESFAVAIGDALKAPVTRSSKRNVFYIGNGQREPE